LNLGFTCPHNHFTLTMTDGSDLSKQQNPFIDPFDDVAVSNAMSSSSTAAPVSTENLQFQDFSQTQLNSSGTSFPAGSISDDKSDKSDPADDTSTLLKAPTSSSIPPEPSGGYSIFSLGYYAKHFDVDTLQVADRLRRSLMPWRIAFYDHETEKPDLYGPFWIISTVVFLMAASGQLAHSLSIDDNGSFGNSYTKISVGATTFYGAASIIPLIIWFSFKQIGINRPLVEILSIYGYSFFPFVPCSIMAVVPHEPIRWALILLAFGFSVVFLIRNLALCLPHHNDNVVLGESTDEKFPKGFFVLAFAFVIHAGITILVKFYFFV